ncbi:MAG: hypothetical protein ACLRXK_02375 [Acutalibacteraceae bacterium]
MGAPPSPKNYSVYSIQTVYSLYVDADKGPTEGGPTIHCKNVIKIPIAEPVTQKIGIDTYTVIPCIAYVFANGVIYPLKIFIETNEGVTVEPIRVQAPLVQYNEAFLLTLPRGTTGIKKAYIRWRIGNSIIQNDLVFDIMEAPYNYENYLPALNHAEFVGFTDYALQRINSSEVATSKLSTEVNNLKARVATLENKVGI